MSVYEIVETIRSSIEPMIAERVKHEIANQIIFEHRNCKGWVAIDSQIHFTCTHLEDAAIAMRYLK
jgi:hypothetical protein